MSTARAPIFETLDAMIAAGWGNVPQYKIPGNWRDIPREVNEQDLERIRDEQFGDPRDLIRRLEESNRLTCYGVPLGAQVMDNERERRRKAYTRRTETNRAWQDRIAWRVAAMRARRANG